MKRIAEAIQLIGNASSTTDKKFLLNKLGNNVPGLKDVLFYIYNPYNKTGISAAKYAKARSLANKDTHADVSYQALMLYLTTHTSGNSTDMQFVTDFLSTTLRLYPDCEWLAEALVTKNLSIGCSVATLNTVYGKGFIPTIGCMLGKKIEDIDRIAWPCIATEKLDGVRRLLVKENGKVTLYSRTGHQDAGLIDIIEDAKMLPDNTVYDGELIASGTFSNCIALRQATNSIANSKGDRTGVTFRVFDMIPLEQFKTGASTRNAMARKTILAATLMDESLQVLEPENYVTLIQAYGIGEELEYIKPVPLLALANSMDEVTPIVEDIWANGGEGVMLNVAAAPYQIKRTSNLIKMKNTEEYALPIVGFIEGQGKYEDSLGAVLVKYKDSIVGVGSGFTNEERDAIWGNQEYYMGQVILIDSFGESINVTNNVSLNCPIFKRFVGDEE